MTDGWVEAVSQRADDGGLVLRYLSGSDYYLLAFRDDQAPAPRGAYNLAIYHHFGWEYRELWHGDVRWPRGSSHAIRLAAEGRRLRAYFDGELAGEVTLAREANDPVPYFGRGGIGVRSYGLDSSWVTTFAAFRWRGVDRKQ